MAQYDTWTKTKGDITVTISKKQGGTAGERLVAFLKWLSEKVVDPDYGIDSGARPDQGLPGQPPRPDQGLPPGPDNTLPGGAPPRPDQGLPGSQPGPDNTLPGGAPSRPDQGLPGQQPGIDNSLPGAIGDHAEEIAKIILARCFDCKDGAQPK